MTYSIATLAKAVFAGAAAFVAAAVAASGGPDLSHLQLDQWLEALGPALVASAALLHKPQTKDQAAPNAVAATSVTDVLTSATTAHADLVKQAIEGVVAVQKATGDLTKLIPGIPAVGAVENTVLNEAQLAASALGLGPLASQVIKLAPRF